MAEEQKVAKKFPEYVTDGSHIYIWHDEYEQMLADHTLRPSDPPPPVSQRPPSMREMVKREAERRKALEEAERMVRLLSDAQLAQVIHEEAPALPTGVVQSSPDSKTANQPVDMDE